uniref:Uncharacterized protein n=1 Tax=Glossina austeni TaxID=7395 RepID=A0A1A9UV71_GLOAU
MSFADKEIAPASCASCTFSTGNFTSSTSLLHVTEPTAREPYGNTSRWFMTLLNQPQFRAVFKGFKVYEHALAFGRQ